MEWILKQHNLSEFYSGENYYILMLVNLETGSIVVKNTDADCD